MTKKDFAALIADMKATIQYIHLAPGPRRVTEAQARHVLGVFAETYAARAAAANPRFDRERFRAVLMNETGILI